jgi:hypothetical protein
MVMGIEVLKDIREELRELRLLYKELVEKLLPIEEPSEEEREAIEEKDEIADEKELMRRKSCFVSKICS